MSRLLNVLENNKTSLPPRGDLWLSSDFLAKAGFQDTIENHFLVAEELGHEMVCLPVAEQPRMEEVLGYQYFAPEQIEKSFAERTQCVAVVIDGPFQRLVGRMGLMEVLMNWGKGGSGILDEYATEQDIALKLIDLCLEKGVDAVVLADDLSGDQRPMISPIELEYVCSPFYQKAISRIHDAGAAALLHCCGNLTEFITIFNSWNIDGLAAIQTTNNDIDLLDSTFKGIFMTGIEARLLEKEVVSDEELEELKRFVSRFHAQKRLILSSSSGLYKGDFWERLQKIYEHL